ncbi:hypothetical protein FA13DRAFT_896358 [Coprinellus micaceus]|uniref:F-box domain-containing protein n=1 Tax=Coprinellus micaceus TaxID=71717 RepID=A0A4Y7TUM2_COPMI|nr:hypothetical protein FA13DRAFT_896358 [Coprinellus micaceus]
MPPSPPPSPPPPAFPFHHLFFTNQVPQATDIPVIQHEIAKMATIIEYQEQQLYGLHACLRQWQGLLSPVRALPSEIIGEILCSALETSTAHGTRRELINFCLVSKYWREAALSTPALWSRVNVPSQLTREGSQNAIQWLQRAGGVSKEMTVGCVHSGSRYEVLVELLDAVPQLDKISFQLCFAKCFQPLVGLMQNAQPSSWRNVKALEFHFYDFVENKGTRDSLPDGTFKLTPLPAITSLHLHLPPDWDLGIRTDKFLSRLRTFNLRCELGDDEILKVLKPCTNLETLILDLEDTRWYSSSPPATVSLPKLRTLRLKNLYQDSLDVLESMKMPSLEELEVDISPDPEDEGYDPEGPEHEWPDWRWFRWMRPFRTLRRITLRNYKLFSGDHAMDLLGLVPNLTHATFDNLEYPSCCDFFALAPESRLEVLEMLNVPFEARERINVGIAQFYKMFEREGKQRPDLKGRRIRVTYQIPFVSVPAEAVGSLDSRFGLAKLGRSMGAEVNIGYSSTPP